MILEEDLLLYTYLTSNIPKCIVHAYPYKHRCMQLSTLIKDENHHRKPHMFKIQRIIYNGMLLPKRYIYNTTPVHKAQEML